MSWYINFMLEIFYISYIFKPFLETNCIKPVRFSINIIFSHSPPSLLSFLPSSRAHSLGDFHLARRRKPHIRWRYRLRNIDIMQLVAVSCCYLITQSRGTARREEVAILMNLIRRVSFLHAIEILILMFL